MIPVVPQKSKSKRSRHKREIRKQQRVNKKELEVIGEDTKQELLKLRRTNKLLQARINRLYKRQAELQEEIVEIDEVSVVYEAKPASKGCEACNGPVDTIQLPKGLLEVCTICFKRKFKKV